MATSTPNLNLILPDYSDKADISVLNSNFQKIDEYCANDEPNELEQIKSDVSSVRDHVDDIATFSPNLFNRDAVIEGGYFDLNTGEVKEQASARRILIPVSAGVYTYAGSTGLFGTTVHKTPMFDVSGNYVKTIYGEAVGDITYGKIVTYTVSKEDIEDGVVYAGYSVNKYIINAAMYVRGDEYPDTYQPYGKIQIASGMAEAIEKELTTMEIPYIEHVKSVNLFDKRKAVKGGYYDATNGQIVAYEYGYTCMIPVSAGTYTFGGAGGTFGTSVSKVPMFDAAGNYVKTIVGTSGDKVGNATLVTYTISDEDIAAGVAFAGFTANGYTFDTAMYVEGTEYPAEYIEFFELVKIPLLRDNALVGKTVAFDGDSICAGASAGDGLSGWAGRIGNANGMNWKNYGIGGGTITAEVYKESGAARHWISRNIDTIHAEMPELDYLILEGGTNDADLLTESTQMGTFDLGDFGGVYDDTTFCGALETLFYKAVTYYPHAKIGFIIAHRMGYNQYTTNYDTTGSKRYRYFTKAMEICKKWSIPYLNLWDNSHMNPKIASMFNQSLDSAGNIAGGYLYTDGQHLTPAGYAHITPMIAAWMSNLGAANSGEALGAEVNALKDKTDSLSEEMAELNTAVESIAGVTEIVSVVFAESNIIHDAMINGYPGSATYGGVAQTNGYVCTTMIPLDFDAGKPVSVRCTLSGYAGLGIYDQGGNTLVVITGVNAADYGLVSGQGMKTYTIIMPEGAKYVRMSASTSTVDGSPAYATPSDFVLMGEKTSGLSDKIAALENEINSNVTDIASKKVLVIGDSISADYYGDYPKWVTHLIDIGFFNSSNTANDSVHATGFVARYNNEANDFISRIATVTNPEVYDMVIVFGGINDYIKDIPMGESGGDKLTSFKPAVDDFFAMLTERFVGARIAVLSPLRTKNYNIANAAGHKQTDYADYIKTVAQTYALPVLDLMNRSGFHPEHETFRQRWTFKNWTGGDGTLGDGTHPIEEYERKHLAPMIRHFLQGLI